MIDGAWHLFFILSYTTLYANSIRKSFVNLQVFIAVFNEVMLIKCTPYWLYNFEATVFSDLISHSVFLNWNQKPILRNCVITNFNSNISYCLSDNEETHAKNYFYTVITLNQKTNPVFLTNLFCYLCQLWKTSKHITPLIFSDRFWLQYCL